MFYTMTQYGMYWKATEDLTETTGTCWMIVQNVMEKSRNVWKLPVSYKSQAQLTSTLTHIVTHNHDL